MSSDNLTTWPFKFFFTFTFIMGVANSANMTERSIDYYTRSTAPVEIKSLLTALHKKT